VIGGRRTLVAIVALGLAALALALRPRLGAPRAPRLVLLYAPCTVARAYLAPYDPAVRYTPHLAAFAGEGVVFANHQTEEGQSGVAYAALFSGHHADRHAVFDHPSRLSDEPHLVAEAFRDGGYETFFWADHPMASPELNYAQGVDARNIVWTKRSAFARAEERFLRGDDARFRRILDRLRAEPDYRAFVLTNFTVTHAPYSEAPVAGFCREFPAECAGLSVDDLLAHARLFHRHYLGWVLAFEETAAKVGLSAPQAAAFARAVEVLYKSNVHRLDALFGAVVDEIAARGLLADSVVAFTADHGEILGADAAGRRWTHGFSLHADDLLVPLVVRAPALGAARYAGVTRSIDVLPTLLGLAGVPVPSGAGGVDLSAALRRRVAPRALRAFSHTALQQVASPGPVFPSVLRGPSRTDPQGMWIDRRREDLLRALGYLQ
jgi:arylsulfatase A-like enzyme